MGGETNSIAAQVIERRIALLEQQQDNIRRQTLAEGDKVGTTWFDEIYQEAMEELGKIDATIAELQEQLRNIRNPGQ